MYKRHLEAIWLNPMWQAPDDKGGGDGDKGDDKEKTPDPITFKDEAALMARMSRHTNSAQEKAAKDAGYESWAAMVEAAKGAKAKSESEKSDLEKEKAARTSAEAKTAEALSKSEARLVKSEAKVLSVELGIANADAAMAVARELGYLADVKVDEQDNVVGLKDALTKLVKDHGYLKINKAPGKNGGDNSGGGGDDKRPNTYRDAVAAAIRKQS